MEDLNYLIESPYYNIEELKTLFYESPKPEPEKKPWNINTHYDTAYRHLKVTPLAEIHSVTIHSKGEEKCEIYGRIHVVDKLGDELDLFSRDKDEAEAIELNGSLLLSSPVLDSKGGVNVIIPSEFVRLYLKLFNKADNDKVIAQGCFVLDRTIIDCKGEHIRKDVEGDCGFARVHYAFFPFAVVATVDVLFFSKDNDVDRLTQDVKVPDVIFDEYREEPYDMSDNFDYDIRKCGSNVTIDIFGTVTARSGIPVSDGVDKKGYDNSSVLFRRLPEQSVQVTSGGFIKLSRSNFAVPAYSSLKIEVDLSDRDTQLPIGRGTLEFIPQDSETYKKDIVGDNGRIRLRVKWNECYEQLYRAASVKRRSESLTQEIEDVENQKRLKLLTGQQSPVTFSCIPPALPKTYFDPFTLVEVFSIAVCSKDFEPFHFYGKITVNSNEFCIFSKDANCPKHCPPLGTLVEIAGEGRIHTLDNFSVWVDLKDPNKSVISKGFLSWRGFNLYQWGEWLNKRLCSLIRGDKGFAAVHYMIIYDAISAFVDVKISGNVPSNQVYGKLVARYGTHDYSRSDEEYYQSILFHKDKEDGPTIDSGCNIPLLKYVVAMPRTSNLVVVADLFVAPVGANPLSQETVFLHQSLNFALGLDAECSREITVQNVRIDVSVKFKFGLS